MRRWAVRGSAAPPLVSTELSLVLSRALLFVPRLALNSTKILTFSSSRSGEGGGPSFLPSRHQQLVGKWDVTSPHSTLRLGSVADTLGFLAASRRNRRRPGITDLVLFRCRNLARASAAPTPPTSCAFPALHGQPGAQGVTGQQDCGHGLQRLGCSGSPPVCFHFGFQQRQFINVKCFINNRSPIGPPAESSFRQCGYCRHWASICTGSDLRGPA